jgi:hypothetical protein
MSAAVVAHGRTDVFRDGVEVADEFFNAERFKGAMPFQSGVELVDVGLVVLGMMNLHRARVDVRLQRVIGIFQFRQCMGHRTPPWVFCLRLIHFWSTRSGLYPALATWAVGIIESHLSNGKVRLTTQFGLATFVGLLHARHCCDRQENVK